jgi:hypothetical protein
MRSESGWGGGLNGTYGSSRERTIDGTGGKVNGQVVSQNATIVSGGRAMAEKEYDQISPRFDISQLLTL